MGKIQSFEDAVIWQEARALVGLIYQVTRTPPAAKDFGFRDQLQRASVSIMTNIAEGFERGSNKELLHFLFIAKGSTAEVRSLLCVAADLQYVDKATCASLQTKAMGIAQQISQLIKYLQTSPYKGVKHKKQL